MTCLSEFTALRLFSICSCFVVCGSWSVVSGQWSTDDGHRTTVNEQWRMNNEPRTTTFEFDDDDPAAPEPPGVPALSAVSEDQWRFDSTAWIWLMGVEGDVGARGLTTNVDASFWDVLDESDSIFALSGRIELGKGRLAGFVDGMWADIGVDDVSGPLGIASIDITFQMAVVDFGLIYRLAEWSSAAGAENIAAPEIVLDAYAGARYVNLDLELDPATLASVGHDKDWIDPIVGARFTMPISKHFHLTTWGDIGGFGVSSDFTWSATGVIGYDFELFKHPASVLAGYRAVGMDYTSGSGASRFEWDVTLHGPLIGFELQF